MDQLQNRQCYGHESHEGRTTNLAWDSGARQQADQGRSRQQGERRPYLSAESCTHSAAGKSGSDSHRPKPSAMEQDPVRPAAERTPNGQEGRVARAARQRARANSGVVALELVFGGEIRLVGVACCGSVALRPFPLPGWCFTNSQVVFRLKRNVSPFQCFSREIELICGITVFSK